MTVKTLTYKLYCTDKNKHDAWFIEMIRIDDQEDAEESFRIDHKGTKSASYNETTGVYAFRCQRCPRYPKVFSHNLAKILYRIGESTGEFDVDISLYRLDSLQ